MKRAALLLAPLLLAGCLGQETTRARYDADQQERAGIEAKARGVIVYWSKKPERAYDEVGLVTVRTSEDAQANRHAIQVEVAKLGADAGIVMGQHSQEKASIITNTGAEGQNFVDVVAITWKP